MKRFMIYDLRFKTLASQGLAKQVLKIFLSIFLLLFINHHSLFINHALAAGSTPSAEIKSKLEELKKEIASKAAKLKQEINRKLKDKAYVGLIKLSSETSLTLAAFSGPKIVSINQDTVFESKQSLPSKDVKLKSKKKFSQESLSDEDYVAALGDIDETGVLTAKKIILLPTPNSQLKTYLWGQVISISDKLITLKDKNFKNVAASLPLKSKIKLNDFVILTGSIDKNDIFDTGFIYVIPQGGIIKPKKVATPSAQTATKSAKTATPSAKTTKKTN